MSDLEQDSKLEILMTSDGSHTLFVPSLNETYHSTNGALAETLHIYIGAGLDYVANHLNISKIKILEFGFGTGLNAIASLQFAESNKNCLIEYFTVEKFPIPVQIIHQLNYKSLFSESFIQNSFELLHDSTWNSVIKVSDNFQLIKFEDDFISFSNELNTYDLIYYDAFAPSKQAEVWQKEYIEKAYNLLKNGGVLVTYCSNGTFKRNLKECGFAIELLAGPVGKREIVRATKL